MTLKTTDRVATAPNLQAALVELAAGIDAILTQLQSQPHDSWQSWGQQPGPVTATLAMQAAAPTSTTTDARLDLREIDAVKAELAKTTDPEDRQALEARLRLLTDTGVAQGPSVTEGRRVAATDHGDALTVELPPPTPERMASRVAWAQGIRLPEYLKNLTEAEVLRGFALGGPQWLYLGDRDAVMTLSLDARRWLVNDLEKDSPAEAHEMGRDILKADFEGSRDAAQEHLLTAEDLPF